jgi:hypothetical protein
LAKLKNFQKFWMYQKNINSNFGLPIRSLTFDLELWWLIEVKSCPGSLAIMSRRNFDSKYIRKINTASRLNLYVSQKPVAGNLKLKFWHVYQIEFYQFFKFEARIHLKSAQYYRIKFSAQSACVWYKLINSRYF